VTDVTALFPGIGAYARTATRLHPRRGTPDPTGSHVGAPPLWPAGEPWPACARPHVVYEDVPVPPDMDVEAAIRHFPGLALLRTEGDGRRFGEVEVHRPEPVPTPLVPVAQLHAADIPDLPCPAGTDLLQVLWCPALHPDVYGPWVSLYWRRAADLGGTVADPPPPDPTSHGDHCAPRPCVLAPERVVEYPWWEELPSGLRERVHAWDDANDWVYTNDLALAPGWKVGGWASWGVTDLKPMACRSCGDRPDPLVTVDSCEEDATDVVVGRYGALRIFTCRRCPGEPPQVEIQ
jgi:hypothetical protein